VDKPVSLRQSGMWKPLEGSKKEKSEPVLVEEEPSQEVDDYYEGVSDESLSDTEVVCENCDMYWLIINKIKTIVDDGKMYTNEKLKKINDFLFVGSVNSFL